MQITGHPDEAPEKTIAERAYRRLREDIVAGALKPGQKLKIDMLRDRYALGAGPLREALSRLAGDHLVTLQGQRGFVVAPMSVKDATEIGQMRQMLEAEALRQSIPMGDAAWEERVILSWHRLEQVELAPSQGIDHLPEWERLNGQFHTALVSACTSNWVLRLRATMFRHHERYRLLSRVRTVATRDVHEEHRRLYEAALARDVPAAMTVIGLHVQRTTDAVTSALDIPRPAAKASP